MNSVTQNIIWTQIPKVFCIGPSYDLIIAIFWFLPKFGCHGDVICSLKNSSSMFEFANPGNLSYVQKCLPTLYRTKICAVFTYFCLYLVVMATLFALFKILIAYFYSRTPKTLLFTVKISRFLAQHWNQCNFCWRLLKFGCHGNSFRSYKISDNICEFADY